MIYHTLYKQFERPDGSIQAYCGRCGTQVVVAEWPSDAQIPCVLGMQLEAMQSPTPAPVRQHVWPWTQWLMLAQKYLAARRRWYEGGKPQPSAEELAVRKAACATCSFRVRGVFDRCGKCGCFLSPKQKMKTETCPLRKWGELPETACIPCEQSQEKPNHVAN